MKREFSDELISAYLDGELTSAEQAEVEAALRSRGELRQMVEDFQRLREELERLPRQQLDDDFADRVLRRAERTMVTGETGAAGAAGASTNGDRETGSGRSGGGRVSHSNGELVPARLLMEQQTLARRWRFAFMSAASLLIVTIVGVFGFAAADALSPRLAFRGEEPAPTTETQVMSSPAGAEMPAPGTRHVDSLVLRPRTATGAIEPPEGNDFAFRSDLKRDVSPDEANRSLGLDDSSAPFRGPGGPFNGPAGGSGTRGGGMAGGGTPDAGGMGGVGGAGGFGRGLGGFPGSPELRENESLLRKAQLEARRDTDAGDARRLAGYGNGEKQSKDNLQRGAASNSAPQPKSAPEPTGAPEPTDAPAPAGAVRAKEKSFFKKMSDSELPGRPDSVPAKPAAESGTRASDGASVADPRSVRGTIAGGMPAASAPKAAMPAKDKPAEDKPTGSQPAEVNQAATRGATPTPGLAAGSGAAPKSPAIDPKAKLAEDKRTESGRNERSLDTAAGRAAGGDRAAVDEANRKRIAESQAWDVTAMTAQPVVVLHLQLPEGEASQRGVDKALTGNGIVVTQPMAERTDGVQVENSADTPLRKDMTGNLPGDVQLLIGQASQPQIVEMLKQLAQIPDASVEPTLARLPSPETAKRGNVPAQPENGGESRSQAYRFTIPAAEQSRRLRESGEANTKWFDSWERELSRVSGKGGAVAENKPVNVDGDNDDKQKATDPAPRLTLFMYVQVVPAKETPAGKDSPPK